MNQPEIFDETELLRKHKADKGYTEAQLAARARMPDTRA